MRRVFQPLLFLIARSTHQLLARHLEFDDAQIEMVRERVPKKNIHLPSGTDRPPLRMDNQKTLTGGPDE